MKSGKKERESRVWAEEAECRWKGAEQRDRWREGSGGGPYSLLTYRCFFRRSCLPRASRRW